MGRYSLGVDVGGTNTDVVLFDADVVKSIIKLTTSKNVSDAVIAGVRRVFSENPDVSPKDVGSIQLGTTHMINALKQRKGLDRVAVIRLAAPSTTSLPPLCDWKDASLKAYVGAYIAIVNGGYNYDGKPISRLNKQELIAHIEAIKAQGITQIAVSGVYKDVNPDQELAVKALIESLYPEANVFLSLPYAGMLLQKENAAIISAALDQTFRHVIADLDACLKKIGLVNSQLLVSENGGTMSPVAHTNASSTLRAATRNSVAGAIQLCAKQPMQGVVVNIDIGGTTADGVISCDEVVLEQFHHVEEAGVIFSFPTVRGSSMCLGGGTSILNQADQGYVLGESVAKDLANRALCCGGDVLTITDIAVAKGRLNFADVKFKALPGVDIEAVDDFIHQQLAAFIVDVGAKIQRPAQGVRLVGGGASLFDLAKLKVILAQMQPSISSIVRPEGADVANAIGAGLALLSATHTAIFDISSRSLESAEAKVTRKAQEALLKKGVDKNSIVIKSPVSEIIRYLPGNPCRIRVTCEGKKAVGSCSEFIAVDDDFFDAEALLSDESLFSLADLAAVTPSRPAVEHKRLAPAYPMPLDKLNALTAAAEIKERVIGLDYLGSGGGGSAKLCELMVLEQYALGKTINDISLHDVPDEAVIFGLGFIGSPDVMGQNPPSIESMCQAVYQLEAACGCQCSAVFPFEAGGANGLLPYAVAAELGLPVVRCDAMGRAFPGVNQVTPFIAGVRDIFVASVASVASANGCQVVRAESADALEVKTRAITASLGGIASLSYLPMTGRVAKDVCIANTPAIATVIGKAVIAAQRDQCDPLPCINAGLLPYKSSASSYGDLMEVASGQVKRLYGFDEDAFSIGALVIQAKDAVYEIIFQNENLVLRQRYADGSSNLLTQVPDLIIVVDAENYEPFGSQDYGNLCGQKVRILTMEAPPLLKTEAALRVVGPDSPIYKLKPVLDELDKRSQYS